MLEVFVRAGCPHCAAAKEFLPIFAGERPGLRIVLREVDHDAIAREDLKRYSQSAGIWPPGVPTFVFNEQVLVGFQSAERTGPKLAALVDRRSNASGSVETGLFGTLSVSRLGLPLFTLALGLLDGFNPCAMWVLLFCCRCWCTCTTASGWRWSPVRSCWSAVLSITHSWPPGSMFSCC